VSNLHWLRFLAACFEYLPRTETIYQGDFIGFGGSDEYTPNTITYKFPEIVRQTIIIAPHTCYYAESDIRDAVAMPDRAIWNDNDTVKFVKPNTYIFHNQESFADVEEVVSFARQVATTVEFVSDKQAAKIKKQLNACIRSGDAIIAQTFEDFDCDPNLIGLWALVKSIKEDALHLCRNQGPDAYIGYDRIDAEGYVMTNEFGMFKSWYSLFNRQRYSLTQTLIKGGFSVPPEALAQRVPLAPSPPPIINSYQATPPNENRSSLPDPLQPVRVALPVVPDP
jgi:hypothetical protein